MGWSAVLILGLKASARLRQHSPPKAKLLFATDKDQKRPTKELTYATCPGDFWQMIQRPRCMAMQTSLKLIELSGR